MTEKLLADNRGSKYIFAPKIASKGKSQKLTNREAFVISHFAGQVIRRDIAEISSRRVSRRHLALCPPPPSTCHTAVHVSHSRPRVTQPSTCHTAVYVSQVIYRTEGWLRKNTDTLHEDLQARRNNRRDE